VTVTSAAAISHPLVPPTADLTQLVRTGDLLFLSGQIGTGPDGTVVSADPGEQMRRAFENVRTLLGAAGAGLDDVVKLTSYLVDPADRPVLRTVKQEFFGEPFPASTLVVVRQLASTAYLYEVDVIARLGHGASLRSPS
jgi:2-iminobutanoate/2-iminopropanoate deaminase